MCYESALVGIEGVQDWKGVSSLVFRDLLISA